MKIIWRREHHYVAIQNIAVWKRLACLLPDAPDGCVFFSAVAGRYSWATGTEVGPGLGVILVCIPCFITINLISARSSSPKPTSSPATQDTPSISSSAPEPISGFFDVFKNLPTQENERSGVFAMSTRSYPRLFTRQRTRWESWEYIPLGDKASWQCHHEQSCETHRAIEAGA